MTHRRPYPQEIAAVRAARALIAERGAEGRHHVASALLAGDGRLFTALNLESVLPQAAVCAEPGTLAMAFSAEPAVETVAFIAAVNRRGEVIPPCGVCRELLLDHAPEAGVAVPGGEDFQVAPLIELLPLPYKSGRRARDAAEPGPSRATG